MSRLFCGTILFCALIALGCSAETSSASGPMSPELQRKIEVQIRNRFSGQIPPSVKFEFAERKPSTEFPGWDSVTIYLVATTGKKSEIPLLISKDNKEMAHVDRVPLDFTLPVDGRPVRGNPNAKVTVVSFDDFQCPYCSAMHQKLFPGLMKEYGDKVRFVYKDYPLEQIHPWAVHAAVDANCIAEQNNTAYWDFADYIHENQKTINKDAKGERRPEAEQKTMLDNFARQVAAKSSLDADRLNACVKNQDETAVRASMKEGDRLGVDGTPTIYINGEKLGGDADINTLRSMIDRALVAAGEQPPQTPTATVTK